MRNTMQLIIYNGPRLIPHRKEWELPPVTAEDFNASIHTGKVFQYPEGELTSNMVYIWKTCVPENREESERLVELGKWEYIYPV